METLVRRLYHVSDAYEGFVAAVRAYAEKKPSRRKAVEAFLDENPHARSSDILGFISEQDDFYEDAAPARSEKSFGMNRDPSDRADL
jgi:hypothetical protein|uniref:hypothetical protein n=1 Tax=Eubacterium cellulosolvens TaxID=29322 RepID=UPI0004861D3D|nr:hypothetical protein [[Eubacterium] cellulosolvens]